jgi:hypothetical protein
MVGGPSCLCLPSASVRVLRVGCFARAWPWQRFLEECSSDFRQSNGGWVQVHTGSDEHCDAVLPDGDRSLWTGALVCVCGSCVCACCDWCGSFLACERVQVAPGWSPKGPLSRAAAWDARMCRLRHSCRRRRSHSAAPLCGTRALDFGGGTSMKHFMSLSEPHGAPEGHFTQRALRGKPAQEAACGTNQRRCNTARSRGAFTALHHPLDTPHHGTPMPKPVCQVSRSDSHASPGGRVSYASPGGRLSSSPTAVGRLRFSAYAQDPPIPLLRLPPPRHPSPPPPPTL